MNFSRMRIHAGPYGARARRNNRIGLAVAATLAATLAAEALAEVRIAALGDSLTAGFGLSEAEGFVPRLQAWLDAYAESEVRVINAGISGDTTAGGRARVDWVLADDPDAVIVALGGNDLLRGLDPAAARENLEAILAALDARGIPALLAGLPAPENYGEAYQREFDAIWPALADDFDVLLYPNFMGGIGERLEEGRAFGMMQDDGIHPNAAGVEAMVEHIGPFVLSLIARAGERPESGAGSQ
jgi:acyl-CoA thioesterase I